MRGERMTFACHEDMVEENTDQFEALGWRLDSEIYPPGTEAVTVHMTRGEPDEPEDGSPVPVKGDRGFKHGDWIGGASFDMIRVSESSNAEQACIRIWTDEVADWSKSFRDPENRKSGHCQLTLESAALLRDQLDYLVRNHYQVQWAAEAEEQP